MKEQIKNNGTTGAKRLDLHTWVGTPIIIVNFDVVIIAPIAGINV